MANETELSDREREILRLVATGASNKQIAQQLVISTNTVKVHLRNIFAKIEVTSRTEATLYAIREGLVATPGGGLALVEGRLEDSESQVLLSEHKPNKVVRVSLTAAVLLVLIAVIGYNQKDKIFPRSSPVTSFQPTAVRWQFQADLPTARSGLAATVYDEQIYAIGGEGPQGVTGETERYKPDTNRWENLASKPNPVMDASAAAIAGKIYVPGGKLPTGEATDVLDIFNSTTGTWQEGARLPIRVYGYALASLEGKLYLFGGWDGQQVTSNVYEYFPDDNQWKQLAHMPTARAYAGATALQGRIVVLGGFDGEKPLNNNEVYYPGRDTGSDTSQPWEKHTPLPEPRYGMGITSLVDTVYVVGGTSAPTSDTPAKVAWQYFPRTDNWTPFDFPEEPVGSGLNLLAVNSSLYAFGGNIDGQQSTHMLSFKVLYSIMIPLVPDQSK